MSFIGIARPIAPVVASNVIYHICAKSTPSKAEPFASLIVTYYEEIRLTNKNIQTYLFIIDK